jgi:hypothetical protein
MHKQPIIKLCRVSIYKRVLLDGYASVTQNVVEQLVLQAVLKQHSSQTVNVPELYR